jgi:hypothetical protein
MLLYIGPHITFYVSSYYYICALTGMRSVLYATIYGSSYYYACVLILLYMCLTGMRSVEDAYRIYISMRTHICVCIAV